MRAEAVWAVRRGLRIEFSRPELPRRSRAGAASGRPMTLDIGRATSGASMPTPRKTADRAEPDELDGRLGEPEAEQPRCRRRRRPTDDDPPARRLGLLAPGVGDGGHRRDAHGPSGRADGRHHGHPDPDDQGGDDGAGLEDQCARRQRDAEPLEQRLETDRGQHPESEAHQRGDQADDGRLGQHRAEHLAPAGADDPQQGQLAGALAHDDREGVEDGEAADEQRDEGEDQQGGREEAERLVDVAGLLVGHGLAGHHLDPGGSDARRWPAGPSPCRPRARPGR